MAATTVSTPIYPLYMSAFGLSPLQITVVFADLGHGVMDAAMVEAAAYCLEKGREVAA